MKISFSERTLKKVANEDRKLFKEYGQKRGKLIKKRLDALAAADNLEELRNAPGHFHELKENRKGQWACDLDQPYRLIFVPHEEPIPTDEDGKYIWIEIKGVDVTEITDYH
ncbi:MAG: type II toxin-antitoxin system RelE/ParE family toxin [Saprospiraceae bacterium]|nr:type II toxin-antitoxin system RelE/ParE family toxin [Saprospiraceae bacterium]MCB9342639.1 type II toxin-antitoxin system RelE/ParE family toxin [Lewinellaceae bacterium]